jgi:glycosyltransferase involved in cell wall biosynthesis
MCYQKGYDLLIDAWEIVDKKIDTSSWSVDVYGDGEDFVNLTEKVERMHFKNKFNIRPAINNINEKLSEASFYVMSSRFETFPMVLLEAMSNKLPIVSFDCPTGPRSIVTDGKDSLLAPEFNVNDLALKILYMIENPIKREEMSIAAYENVKFFSPKVIMNQWNELISK